MIWSCSQPEVPWKRPVIAGETNWKRSGLRRRTRRARARARRTLKNKKKRENYKKNKKNNLRRIKKNFRSPELGREDSEKKKKWSELMKKIDA